MIRAISLFLGALALFAADAWGQINAPTSAAPPDDGQWTMPAKNFANTRYSELKEITPGTVGRLGVAFTLSTSPNRAHP